MTHTTTAGSYSAFLSGELQRLQASLGQDVSCLREFTAEKNWAGVSFCLGEITEKTLQLREITAKLDLLDWASKPVQEQTVEEHEHQGEDK